MSVVCKLLDDNPYPIFEAFPTPPKIHCVVSVVYKVFDDNPYPIFEPFPTPPQIHCVVGRGMQSIAA